MFHAVAVRVKFAERVVVSPESKTAVGDTQQERNINTNANANAM
jgi:hypothetical protein